MNRIDKQFQHLEQKKEKLLQALRTLDPDIYVHNPSPDRWSVGQIANHLYLSEKLSLAYLKKKLSYPESVPRYSIRSWGSVLILKLVYFTSYKAKSPKAINMWEDQPVLAPPDLEQKWKELRQELIGFIRKNQPAFGSHLAYRHPFSGRMTMLQMLIFFNDHMKHHIDQIHRILEKKE